MSWSVFLLRYDHMYLLADGAWKILACKILVNNDCTREQSFLPLHENIVRTPTPATERGRSEGCEGRVGQVKETNSKVVAKTCYNGFPQTTPGIQTSSDQPHNFWRPKLEQFQRGSCVRMWVAFVACRVCRFMCGMHVVHGRNNGAGNTGM